MSSLRFTDNQRLGHHAANIPPHTASHKSSCPYIAACAASRRSRSNTHRSWPSMDLAPGLPFAASLHTVPALLVPVPVGLSYAIGQAPARSAESFSPRCNTRAVFVLFLPPCSFLDLNASSIPCCYGHSFRPLCCHGGPRLHCCSFALMSRWAPVMLLLPSLGGSRYFNENNRRGGLHN